MTIFFAAAMVSCSEEDNSVGMTTNYGSVTSTGYKTATVFMSAHDGRNQLTIPGFAPILVRGTYNVYLHYVNGAYLYSTDNGNEFQSWSPGEPVPSEFGNETGFETNSGTFVGNYNMLVRTKIKNSNEYVYAFINITNFLNDGDRNVIGVIVEYESPVDPNTYKTSE